MTNKKLKLKELKVNSFVTSLNNNKQLHVKSGNEDIIRNPETNIANTACPTFSIVGPFVCTGDTNGTTTKTSVPIDWTITFG